MEDQSFLKILICLILSINIADSDPHQSDLNPVYTTPPNQFQNIPELRIKEVQTDAMMMKDSIKNMGKYILVSFKMYILLFNVCVCW